MVAAKTGGGENGELYGVSILQDEKVLKVGLMQHEYTKHYWTAHLEMVEMLS